MPNLAIVKFIAELCLYTISRVLKLNKYFGSDNTKLVGWEGLEAVQCLCLCVQPVCKTSVPTPPNLCLHFQVQFSSSQGQAAQGNGGRLLKRNKTD